MKKIFYSTLLLLSLAFSLALTSCKTMKDLRTDYDEANLPTTPENLMGDVNAYSIGNTTSYNLGDLSWQQLFKDQYLNTLIDSALARNTDMAVSHLRLEQAEQSLIVAKKAFLPSVYVTPQGKIGSLSSVAVKTCNLPVTASWQADIFGGMQNEKKSAAAQLAMQQDMVQATQCKIVSNIISMYYQLLMLDRGMEVLKQTEEIWNKSVETQRALMKAGQANSAAVDRLLASYYSVKVQQTDIQKQIDLLENNMCRLLAETPHKVQRGKFSDFTMPEQIGTGVPLATLKNRPDVRAAGRSIESAYYQVQKAKANMLPNLTLSGSLGWTNEGLGVDDPIKFFTSLIGSITAPIFAQGKLAAAVKINEAEMKIAEKQYVQTVINAGNEVNSALVACDASKQKDVQLKKQLEALQSAYDATCALQLHGQASYLEVLTAQETLLQSQLSEVENDYDAVMAIIDLYIALGGGR